MFNLKTYAPVIALIIASGLTSCGQSVASESPTVIKSIYWSDADSGRINDTMKFRLNSVDAPETGGVGASIGGAECELERKRGFASKEWIVGLTRDAKLSIIKEYGFDQYDRLVVDLSAFGEDVGRVGIEAGHLKPWPHKGRRALSDKPDWCSNK